MAVTRKAGFFSAIQNQAQSVAQNIADIAAQNHARLTQQAPVNRVATTPRNYVPAQQQTGRFVSGGSAAAAQHIIDQATANRQRLNQVRDNAARVAVMDALALASGQPGVRQLPSQPATFFRMAPDDAAAHFLPPERESQAFDQQIQATKLNATQYGGPGMFFPDSATQQRVGRIDEQVATLLAPSTAPNPRLQQEQAALASFPQMSPQNMRRLSDSQLGALLALAPPKPTATAAGAPDRVGGAETSPNEMTRSGPPKGPPSQPAWTDPLPSYDATTPRSGSGLVADAIWGALNPFGSSTGAGSVRTFGNVTPGGAPSDDDGFGLDDVPGMIASAGHAILESPASPLGLGHAGQAVVDLLRGTPAENIVVALRDAASGTYESFLNSEAGGKFAWLMEKMDWSRQQSVETLGDQAYGAATGKSWEEAQQGRVGSSGSVGAALNLSPDAVIWMAIFEVAPELREPVIDAYENGYTSPRQGKVAEAAGIDPATLPPEFTGGRAVWEMLIGATDDLPPSARYPIRMLADLVMDPLTYLPIVGAGGKGLKVVGAGMRNAEGATTSGRILGGLLEGTGAIAEGVALAPDLPAEAIVRGGKGIGGKVGEVTGLFSPSTAGLRTEAGEAARAIDEAIPSAREAIPDESARHAFDAEAQGAAPASGPRLIAQTPPAGQATPTPTVERGGTPQPGAARFVTETGAQYEALPGGTTQRVIGDAGHPTQDAPSVRTVYVQDEADLVRWQTANATPGPAARETALDAFYASASPTPRVGLRPLEIGADGAPRLGAPITRIDPAGDVRQAAQAGAPTGAGADRVSAQSLQEARDLETFMREGGADENETAEAVQDFLRDRFAQEEDARLATEAPTPQERNAAAAAGGTVDAPRTPAAAATMEATETARAATTGTRRSPMNAAQRKASPELAKAVERAQRMNREDAWNLPKEVNNILRPQKAGEHEFSPVYKGHRLLDRIVTDAIDSGDNEAMKRANDLVRKVDRAVEQHLRTDEFYLTWKNGGVPVYLQNDPRFGSEFFGKMDALDPHGFSDQVLVAKAVGLPEPQRGTTRLYHIEPDGFDGAATSRWFADDPAALGYYIEALADPSGRVWVGYIDVPDAALARFRHVLTENATVQHVGAPAQMRMGALDPNLRSEYIVPERTLSRVQVMTPEQADRMNDLIRLRDNRPPRPGGKVVKTELLDLSRRRHALGNGIAKGVLDDIAEVQFQLKQLFPIVMRDYPEAFSLDGLLGTVGRVESRNFRDESAEWLIREYLDTTDAARAESILMDFLANPNELPVIADGAHMPYGHSIAVDYQPEAIARLREMRERWRKIKRSTVARDAERRRGVEAPRLEPVEPDPGDRFRPADPAAQFAGGSRQASKSLGQQLRDAAAARKRRVVSDEDVLLAIGDIRDPEIRDILLKGDGRLTAEQARLADRSMPQGWKPAWYDGPKTEWNVKEALDSAREQALLDPAFDHRRAVQQIGELSHGLQPKLTGPELTAARRAAKANGIDPKTIKSGASAMERATATKGVRALDAYLRHYRAARLFNPIVGLGNRIGDMIGNTAVHLAAGDVRGALRQVPLTFTEAKAFRDVARDPQRLLEQWSVDASHMAETGMVYPKEVMGHTRLLDIDETTGLPPLNAKVAGTPRAVRTAASLWSSPALKDLTTAGEISGRRIAFDRVYTETLQRDALPAFRAELERRFPGEADRILNEIAEQARGRAGQTWSGYFSAGDVLAATSDTQLQRMWQRELNRASRKGAQEADRLFFSGTYTNADEIARRVFTFHFWMTRASVFYGRLILRNPILLSGVIRIYQRAHEISREQGLPDWLSGMMKFFAIPGAGTGYAAFDPVGALFPTFFLDAYSQEGNRFQAFQNLLVPIWSGALGALGLTQNVPDYTATRNIERAVIDLGNFLKGEGVALSSIPGFGQYIDEDSLTLKIPTEEFTKKIIEAANRLIGEPFGEFKPFDRQANEQDQLYSIGLQVGTTLWGENIQNWKPEQIDQLNAAVHQAQYGDGEETWLSETIRATYGREGAARAGFALGIPGGVVTRQEFRDTQLKDAQAYWDAFYGGGKTTKAQESAATGRQLATAANPAWIAMNNAYYDIGTDEQKQIYGIVNSMLYDPSSLKPNQTIIIDTGGGVYQFYSMAQLASLSDKDRRTVVETWLASHPETNDAYEAVEQGRAQFETEHPDYAQYTEYRSGVYGYTGGPRQFRKDMRDNPAFVAAEEEERKRLKKEGKTGAVLEAELDAWATSQGAFFAATGQPYKRTDDTGGAAGPISTMALFSLRKDDDDTGYGSDEPKDPTVDDYWSPAKGAPRLQQDQQQYAYDNAEMERRFGDYWNEAAGDWEDWADSSKERTRLGIGDATYVLPSTTETMRRFDAWLEEHPDGTPEEFFQQMLTTQGFGKKPAPPLPGGTKRGPGAK